MLIVAPVHRVALVHHLRLHRPPVGPHHDLIPAAAPAGVPPSGESHHLLVVGVELAVAFRRAAAVAALGEAVHGQVSTRAAGDDRRRALEPRVALAGGAAVGFVLPVALASLAAQVAAGEAGAEAEQLPVGVLRARRLHRQRQNCQDNEQTQ